MPYFRATIRKLISDQKKYYIQFLPVNDKNTPTGEHVIHSYYSYEKSKKGYKHFKSELIQEEPGVHPGETDYTYSSIFLSRHTKIKKIAKHPAKFLKKMERKLQPVFVKTNYVSNLHGANPTLGVNFYKIKGERPYQEDAILIDELNGKFATLGIEEIKKAILNAFKEAENELGEYACGSTALVCLVLNNILYLANLGDSTGYLVTNNHAERLNTKLHDKTLYGRTHILNINGAIGDDEFGDNMIHVPDIYTVKLVNKVNQEKIVLLLASDGLTENSKLEDTKDDVKLLQTMINQHKDYTPEILAKSAILEHESGDNISVIQVDLKVLLTNKKHAVFAVFDGHCGSSVSSKLANQFGSILNHHLQVVLRKNKQNFSTANTLFSHPKKVKNVQVRDENAYARKRVGIKN